MKRLLLVGMLFLVVAAVVASLSSSAFAARVPPGHCICLDIRAPVTCSNGVTYGNACYAARAGATGCVPGNPSI